MEAPKTDEPSLGRFGRYLLLEPLAKGGMAQIYKASTPTGKVFTLKKILQDYSANPDFIKMFLEEAKISLNLKHPNVVRVLDFGQNEGTYFLAMEYVFGKDVGSLLRTSVEKRIYIPIDVACFIVWQCAKGLDYAHNLTDGFGKPTGIIHRDISPPNILISYNGDSKVLDFGIAKAARSTSRATTRSGVLKGKFSYMSPEQASGQPLSPQSDLYSLAIVFYELLTSRSLFFSQDEMETLERVRRGDVDSPRKHRKEIPEELEAIVMKALSRKEKNRFANCAEFADAIRGFLRNHYQRTDSRAVAKFLRACFPEDFKNRARGATKEGWMDILVSGAADDDLMLDRSFSDAESFRTNPRQQEHIGLMQRLLYDPRTNSKLWAHLRRLALLGILTGCLSYAWFSGSLTSTYQSARHLFDPSAKPTTVAESAEVLPIAPAPKPAAGAFSNYMQEAQKAEDEGRFEDLERALNRAKEINPLDPELQVKMTFFRLSSGDFEEPCRMLSRLNPADQTLAAAACFEIKGDIQRSMATYSDFLQRFSSDPRSERVKVVLNSMTRSVQLKE